MGSEMCIRDSSLLGLYIMGLSFIRGLATGAAVGVLVMMVASLTLLPALLGMTGTRIDKTSKGAMIALALVVAGSLGGVITESFPIFGAGLALGILVAVASIFIKPLRAALPHRKQKPTEQGICTGGAASCSAVRGRCSWLRSRSSSRSRARFSASDSGSPTTATRRRIRRSARPTTSWPRDSAPAQTDP